jgi:predicted phosphodiesterase
MRVLVISDIHANLTALEAVLQANEDQYDAVWCLGDLVGYGPNPNECVERVRSLPGLTCLVGNHDKAVLGDLDVNTFNNDARYAILWTRDALSAQNTAYLHSLSPIVEIDQFTLAHASPRQPVWEYILNRMIASENFGFFTTSHCLVGHTHVPVLYQESNTVGDCLEFAPNYERPLALQSNRLIINPGSVGQPRDGNPHAAYALLDLDSLTWQYRRTIYDIDRTQRQMRAQNFPDRLVLRLEQGW